MKTFLSFLVVPLCSFFVSSPASAAATPTPAPKSSPKEDTARVPGRDPGFGFVNLEDLFKTAPQVKTSEASIEAEKAAVEKEYAARIADYRKLEGELGALEQRITTLPTDDASRGQLLQERNERAAALKTREREINEFRQQREQEMQQKVSAIRGPIVSDVKAAANRLGQNLHLVFELGGKTLSGVPFVVLHPVEAEITAKIAGALEGKDAGSVNAMRGMKVAVVDMNKVFTQLRRTKEAETKINAMRETARTENEQKTNAFKEEVAKVDALSGAEKQKQIEKVRGMDKELNEFRTKKNAELQKEMVSFGQPILADMATALGKMAGDKAGLVFDSSGMGISGIPLLVWSKDLPDLSADLMAVLNEGKGASKTSGLLSTQLRFGSIDVERAYRALPEAKQAESEIQEAAQRAQAEAANADAQAQAEKQQQLQNLIRSKRQAVIGKITEMLGQVARAGEFNAVFDLNGKTLGGSPAMLLAREIPDLTDEVLAKASATK